MKRDQLTTADVDTLRLAARLRAQEDDGIFARGVGQRSHFKRLERLGLIEYDGQGVDMDDHAREVQLWKLTEKGEAAAAYPCKDCGEPIAPLDVAHGFETCAGCAAQRRRLP